MNDKEIITIEDRLYKGNSVIFEFVTPEDGMDEGMQPRAQGGHCRPGGRHERNLPAPLGRTAGWPHAGIVRPVIAFRHRAGQAAGIERPGAAFRIDDQAREIASFALGRPVPDGG